MKPGTLHLIPVPLGPGTLENALPPAVLECVRQINTYIAENAKSARAFLKAAAHPLPLSHILIAELNEHTPRSELKQLLTPLQQGHDVGLISEAGCPAVADPGSQLVYLAQQHDIPVTPMIGPCSILLALMASGLSGQNFTFHGYLSAKEPERTQQIKSLESAVHRQGQTQIFIETPYRNQQILTAILSTCTRDTLLCIASDLSLPSQTITTRNINTWRNSPTPEINRRPTVFLLGKAS